MQGIYIFQFETEASIVDSTSSDSGHNPGYNEKSVQVVYCSLDLPDPSVIIERLRHQNEESRFPDRIVIITPSSRADEVCKVVKSKEFKHRIPPYTEHISAAYSRVLTFDRSGKLKEHGTGSTVSEAFQRAVRRKGALSLFLKRNGVQQSGDSYHFKKPSGNHCDKFLRVGNLMVSEVEIEFLAFATLTYVPPRFSYIYCDTGSIIPVATKLKRLLALKACTDQSQRITIDSFSSYDRIDSFDFAYADNSLILISASTSGSLRTKLLKRETILVPDKIVTLFYLGDHDSQKIVCDLTKRDDIQDGIKKVLNTSEGECKLCDKGSTAIPIQGDQFIPSTSPPESVQIAGSDAPRGLSSFIDNYRDTDAIQIITIDDDSSAGGGSGPGKNVLDIDVSECCTSKLSDSSDHQDSHKPTRFERRLDRIISQSVSYDLNRIVYVSARHGHQLDDPSIEPSKILAKRIRNVVTNKYEFEPESIQLLSLDDLRADVEKHTTDEGSTLIISDQVATGRDLLTASQIMRIAQQNNSLTYIIGIARLPSSDDLKNLRTNLTYEERPFEYGFYYVDAVHLPTETEKSNAQWIEETAFLDRKEFNSIDVAQERRNQLDQDMRSGLKNGLFWKSITGDQLRLRPGFAFFDFDYCPENIDQSVVYFAMHSILHNKRQAWYKTDGYKSMTQRRRLLSPLCFDRFNDGVIQAAILRAALPSELDYSINKQSSQQMREILLSMARNPKGHAGEAIREFLYALASSKMRLTTEDIEFIKSKGIITNIDDDICSIMWEIATSDH